MTLTDRAVDVIYRVATGSRRRRAFVAAFGAVVVLCLVAMFIALALWIDRLLQFPPLLNKTPSLILSAAFSMAGLCLYSWAFRHFLRHKGTPIPFSPPNVVITTGPYKYCRNPMLDWS